MRRCVAVSVLALLPLHAACAQRIDVRLVDSLTGVPVAGALVSVSGASAATLAEGLSDSAGRKTFSLADSGVYRVRVRRIGYLPYVSSALELGRGETRLVSFRVPAVRTVLPSVTVSADNRGCGAISAPGASSMALWEAIATALRVTAIAASDTLVSASLERFEQTLDRSGRVTARTTQQVPPGGQLTLFATPDPELLSKRGYVAREGGSNVYYGPDATVLLSDSFARDHCFTVAAGTDAAAGLIGLTFAPVAGRRVPEISGTLWVDPATSELRFLEYQYVNVSLPARTAGVGGKIYFQRLASGAWLVSDWAIRAPLVHLVMSTATLGLDGYRETGGRFTVLASPPGATAALTLAPVSLGRLRGVVFDSLLQAPLPGAVVSLAGVARATTDSAGRFTIDSVPFGTHEITASHVELDSIGVRLSSEATVEDSTAVVTLATPSLATLKRGVCGDSSLVVAGHVRDVSSTEPLRAGVVEFRWLAVSGAATGKIVVEPQAAEVPIGPAGLYIGCIPARGEIDAVAHDDARRSGRVEVREGPRGIAVLDLAVGNTRDAALHGFVRDSSGRPLAGATITSVETHAASRSGADGAYELRALPAGSSSVDVIEIGYAPKRFVIVAQSGTMVTRDLRLDRVVSLPTVNVKASATARTLGAARQREFDDRRKLGWGTALDAAQIEKLKFRYMLTLLSSFPQLRADMKKGHLEMSDTAIPRIGRSTCPPTLYIDGVEEPEYDHLMDYAPSDFAGIEYYPRPSEAPPKYTMMRQGCGVVLVWTKRAGWGG